MTTQEARQIVFENLRAHNCPEVIARRVFDVPGSMIETATALLKGRKRQQLRDSTGMDPATESMLTGKSYEDLLYEKSPERYEQLQKRIAEDAYRHYLQVVRKTPVGEYVDRVHKRLALSIAEQIALDAEYEARWDAIRENLRCAGAHGEER